MANEPMVYLDDLGRFEWLKTVQHGIIDFFVAPDIRSSEKMGDLFGYRQLELCDCDRQADQLELLQYALKLVVLEIHVTEFQVSHV